MVSDWSVDWSVDYELGPSSVVKADMAIHSQDILSSNDMNALIRWFILMA